MGGGGRLLGPGLQDGQPLPTVPLGQAGHTGRSTGAAGAGTPSETRPSPKPPVPAPCTCRGPDPPEGPVALPRKGTSVRKPTDGCADFHLSGGRISVTVRRHESEWGCRAAVFQEGLTLPVTQAQRHGISEGASPRSSAMTRRALPSGQHCAPPCSPKLAEPAPARSGPALSTTWSAGTPPGKRLAFTALCVQVGRGTQDTASTTAGGVPATHHQPPLHRRHAG